MNEYGQAGEVSITPHSRGETPDNITVKLLPGTTRGQVGEIVTISRQVGLREVNEGRAELI